MPANQKKQQPRLARYPSIPIKANTDIGLLVFPHGESMGPLEEPIVFETAAAEVAPGALEVYSVPAVEGRLVGTFL